MTSQSVLSWRPRCVILYLLAFGSAGAQFRDTCSEKVLVSVYTPRGEPLTDARVELIPFVDGWAHIDVPPGREGRVRCGFYHMQIDPPGSHSRLGGYRAPVILDGVHTEVRRVVLEFDSGGVIAQGGGQRKTQIDGVVNIPGLASKSLIVRAVSLADRSSYQTVDAQVIDGAFHISRVGEGYYALLLLEGFEVVATEEVKVVRGHRPTQTVFDERSLGDRWRSEIGDIHDRYLSSLDGGRRPFS